MSIDDSDNPSGQSGTTAPLQSQVKDDLSQVTDKAKHDLDAVTQRAAQDMRDLREEAGAKIGEATDKAKSFADDQKNLAAGQITGVADAINRVAEELEGSEQGTVARYARDLASGLSSMGKTIEERNVDDLMGLAQDFGRKQPIAFLGAAALAGFVASRFAMASAQRREAASSTSGQSSSYGASGASGSYGSSSTGYGSTGSSSSYGSSTASGQGSATTSTYGSSTYDQNRTGGQ
jgi:hypothetical protein